MSFEDFQKQAEAELSNVRGADLIQKLASILARHAEKIERLEASIQLLGTYEENRDLLLSVAEPVSVVDLDRATFFEVGAFEHLSSEDGFHASEFNGAGEVFRWCGEFGSLGFSVHIDRSLACFVELDLVGSVDPENFEKVELFDGDRNVPLSVIQSDGARWTVSAELPPLKKGRAPTQLNFRFPHYRRLSDMDKRVAAVAFQRLTVKVVDQEAAVA